MVLQRSALWAVALAAVAMALPALARADYGTPLLDDALMTYFEVAGAYWSGPVPSCVENGVTIPVHALLYDDPEASVAARAEQPGCRIWVDRDHWREMGTVEACTIIVHEWGHLLGFGHSEDPLNIMAEIPARPPTGCARLDRRTRAAGASSRARVRCGSRAQRARAIKRLRSVRRPRSDKRPRSARRPRYACITRG
jgi:matrixin